VPHRGASPVLTSAKPAQAQVETVFETPRRLPLAFPYSRPPRVFSFLLHPPPAHYSLKSLCMPLSPYHVTESTLRTPLGMSCNVYAGNWRD
jgi:hypothetical protein